MKEDMVWVRAVRNLGPMRFRLVGGSIYKMRHSSLGPRLYEPVTGNAADVFIVYEDGKDVVELTNAELIVEVYSKGRDK